MAHVLEAAGTDEVHAVPCLEVNDVTIVSLIAWALMLWGAFIDSHGLHPIGQPLHEHGPAKLEHNEFGCSLWAGKELGNLFSCCHRKCASLGSASSQVAAY